MSLLSRFRRPTPPATFEPRTDDFAELADLYPPAVLPPVCPVVEPEDPMAALVVALDAVPAGGYVPLSYSFTEVDAAREDRELVRLAALTREVSPLEAAQFLFGGARV